MTDLERLLIERECERLVTRYCHLVDHGEAAKVADLFDENGIWRSPDVTMRGFDEIREGFEARQSHRRRMSRHVCSNLAIDVIDERNATGCVYMTLYRHDGEPEREVSPLVGPVMVGEYRDRFVRTIFGWRFAERETVVSFLSESD